MLHATKYMLSMDGMVVMSSDVVSHIWALAALFAAYYVFAIKYPEEAAATLEFIQRYLNTFHS